MSITEKRLNEIQARLDAATKDWSNQAHESAQVRNFFAHTPRDIADLIAEVHRLRDDLVRQERVAVSEEMRLRRKKAALLIELDATYRKHGETGIEQHHLDAAQADLNAALGGGDDA